MTLFVVSVAEHMFRVQHAEYRRSALVLQVPVFAAQEAWQRPPVGDHFLSHLGSKADISLPPVPTHTEAQPKRRTAAQKGFAYLHALYVLLWRGHV